MKYACIEIHIKIIAKEKGDSLTWLVIEPPRKADLYFVNGIFRYLVLNIDSLT